MTNLFPEIKSVETTMKQQASLLGKKQELVDARMSFRSIVHNRSLSKLRDVYGRKFDYNRFNDAACYIDKYVQESHTFFHKCLTQQTHEQRCKQNQPKKVQKKSQDLER